MGSLERYLRGETPEEIALIAHAEELAQNQAARIKSGQPTDDVIWRLALESFFDQESKSVPAIELPPGEDGVPGTVKVFSNGLTLLRYTEYDQSGNARMSHKFIDREEMRYFLEQLLKKDTSPTKTATEGRDVVLALLKKLEEAS